MPNSCIVPNCTSNYRSNKEKISTFSFPKDPEIKSQWLKNIPRMNYEPGKNKGLKSIPRKNYKPGKNKGLKNIPRKNYEPGKNAVVCAKHFNSDDIILFDSVKRDDGTILTCKRQHAKLKEDAVPIIFPNCPKYLTKKPPKKRTNLDKQEERLLNMAIEESKVTYEKFVRENTFDSFKNLSDLLKMKIKVYEEQNWQIIFSQTDILIARIINTPVPKIQASLKIDKELSVKAFNDNNIICLSSLKNITNLNSLSQIDISLEELKALSQLQALNDSEIVKSLINGICDTLRLIIKEELISTNKIKSIVFLMEQLEFLIQNQNSYRYSNQTLLWCLKLFMQSSSAYKQMYDYGIFNIPHFRNLQKIINQRSMNDIRTNSLEYIKINLPFLKEHEKLVVLQMDEIHINPMFSYKGGNVTGGSETDICQKASSVHTLLISSLLSSYRDVVRLVPVTTMNAEALYEIVLKTIISLENLSFKVIAVITDNNSINRKVFKLFSDGKNLNVSVPSPASPERPLFFILDPVHIIKSVRNNWINKKDDLVSFTYPNFNHLTDTATASFKVLRSLYATENKNLAKCAYKLTLKSLYPSSIERQNVTFALKIFDETNVVALRLNGQSASNSEYNLKQTTSDFIEIFIKWWKIFNIKSPNKGIRLNDNWQMPFTSCSDERLKFLENFCSWIEIWKSSNNLSGLSNETFTALSLTTKSMIEIVQYLLKLDFPNFKYILPGKFQSDMLEQRFSQYRQMSGGNYHISFQQILESEKKLRLCSTIKIGGENINIKKLSDKEIGKADVSNINTNFILEKFGNLLNKTVDLANYDENTIKACVFIAGYISFKIKRKLNCSLCIALLTTNEIMNIEDESFYELISALDRGCLTYPSEYLIQVICFSLIILDLLTSPSQEEIFFKSEICHRTLLSELTELKLIKDDICNPADICVCGKHNMDLIKDALSRSANILIGNYLKTKNQDLKKNSERKVKKFKA